jgi:hypothetical protein
MDCGGLICRQTAINGSGTCNKCAKKGKEPFNWLTKELLYDLHYNKKLAFQEIGKKLNVHFETIGRYCKNYKIKTIIYGNQKDIKLRGQKKKCIDCGCLVSRNNVTRCNKCFKKYNVGKNNTHYKGIKYYCVDCNIQVSDSRHKRCNNCQSKYFSGKRSHLYGKTPPIPKRISYNNFLFRSYWEANFAKWLDLSNIKWKYEPKMFDLGNCTYTPDFYLPTFDCWIEIKGWENKDFKKKFKKWQKQYKLNNRLLFREDLNKLGTL